MKGTHTMATATARSQEAILERFLGLRESGADPWGWRAEALAEALDFTTVVEYLPEHATAEDWGTPDVAAAARDYLGFAVGKALAHRGISATRSITKLGEWLWCLGEDDLAARFHAAPYEPYGAPQLAVLAAAWGLASLQPDPAWTAMAAGNPCTPGCTQGCRA